MNVSIKHIFFLALLLAIPSMSHGVEIIAPPTISNGHWRVNEARNLDRLLLMKDTDLDDIRLRIYQGDELFKAIYTNNFTNRDGGTIGGIYQNASRSTPSNRIDRAVLAKNKAFVALIGIGVQTGTNTLYQMSDEEQSVMREEALALLRTFDNSAWSDQDRPNNVFQEIAFALDHQDELYDLQFRSRELMCYLEAYDMLRPIGGGRVWEESIARRLIKFASNIYFLADFFGAAYAYNNHRVISGSALGMAGILFGDWGCNESNFSNRDVRSYMPKAWIGYGMININTVLYSYQVFPDGGYNEGPHYLRYGFAYALPFFKAMKIFGEVYQINDSGQPYGDWIEGYSTNPGSTYSLRSPWFGRANNSKPDIWDILEWITKIRQPEGRVPGIADTFNDTYFPETAIVGGYYFWPLESYEPEMSNMDFLNWSLSAYADSRVDFIAAGNTYQETPPDWNKLQVFPQTGDIVFRSGWGANDIYLHVYARNYTYSSTDFHRGPHIQDDNGSFLLSFNKQVLALDCGFISWNDREQVADPSHHNLILVTGQGPSRNSTTAQIDNFQRGDHYNYARIRTNYQNTSFWRDFLFCDNQYFIIKDRVDGGGRDRYQWVLHGNDTNPINEQDGVIWQKENARLKAFVTTNGGKGNLDYVFSDQIHDNGYGMSRTEGHKALSVGRTTTDMQYLSILYPYDSAIQDQPEFEEIIDPDYSALFVDRTANPGFGNRYEIILSNWPNTSLVTIPQQVYGTNNRIIKEIKTNAGLLVLSIDPEDPDDPNKITFFAENMSILDYGEFVLRPQFAPKMADINNYSMNEMDTLEVTISATDTNGHYLSFSFSSEIVPSFIRLTNNNDGTANIRFTPEYFDAGTYTDLEIIVKDSGTPQMSDLVTFDITVNNVILPPIANASSDIITGSSPMTVNFTGEASYDLDGSIQSYLWNFGDGYSQLAQNVSHTYDTTRKYLVILTVIDNVKETDSDSLIIINNPNLTEIFISEVSYAVPTRGKFLELYNNLSYDIDLSEYKLVQTDEAGNISNIFDFGSDEQLSESTVLLPANQFLIVGRGISKIEFAEHWEISPDLINYNSGSSALFFGQIGYRWQLRYFDGTPNYNNGTLIDDTEVTVGELDSRSYQSLDGIWTSGSYLDATPGFLDGDESLPVELVSWEVIEDENSILLQWETRSELNNLGFNILRSTKEEGKYEQIASYKTEKELQGQGSSPTARKYSFTDHYVEKNVPYWYKLVDIDFSGKETIHDPVSGEILYISDYMDKIDITVIPDKFMLHNNFPNPFNSTTSVHIDIPDLQTGDSFITLSVFNVLGEQIRDLHRGPLTPGRYLLQWDGKNDLGSNMASGLYILILKSSSYSSTKKMILLQ